MSTSRDSFFYRDIQYILETELPKHGYPVPSSIIQKVLGDLFDSVALHVWSRDDVIGLAREMGKNISQDDADEILSNIERHVDSELGITWQTLRYAIGDFDCEEELF